MTASLKGRNLVSMLDLSMDELRKVLDVATAVKRSPGDYYHRFAYKTLAMIFQKPSLRTRFSFETGMTQMGGHAVYLAPADISLGKRETTEDIAQVLSRYADIIMARVFGHDIVEDLAKYATVPVINGLSDHEHPCQILADLQTILERRGRLAGLDFVYSGDGNNVANSLMYGGAATGMNVTIVTPPGYEPKPDVVSEAETRAKSTGAKINVSNDLMASVKDADVIYTDVWASMGQESDAENRRKFFMPYQVNSKVLAEADPHCVILHCLPAHYGEEIEYDVTRTPNSAIFDQAENRLHAQKALMLLLAGMA